MYLNPFSQTISGPDESLLGLLSVVAGCVEAHVVLPHHGPQVDRYREIGATVHIAPLSVIARTLRGGALAWPARCLRGVRVVASLAKRVGADIIHTNMEVVLDGGLAARVLGIPHVQHYRGNTNDNPKLVFDVLTRAWVWYSAKVLCISNSTAALFHRRGLGSKVETVYNPVRLDLFERATRSPKIRREFGADEPTLLVGAVGRLHPRKDLETFLRAAAIVSRGYPSTRFVIVGAAEVPVEREYETRLVRLAQELGLSKQLVFAGPRRDMPDVLKALDVLVLSSRNEGFGRVVAEAMAAGTPVVATREGALPELVEEGRSGALAAAAVPEEFAEAILQFLRSASRRGEVAARGRARASSAFDANRIGARVLEVYHEAIRNHSR
jgi:glycosyltransferase involved in cell wall biosynthesis